MSKKKSVVRVGDVYTDLHFGTQAIREIHVIRILGAYQYHQALQERRLQLVRPRTYRYCQVREFGGVPTWIREDRLLSCRFRFEFKEKLSTVDKHIRDNYRKKKG